MTLNQFSENVICSIDFGTSGTSFSYVFTNAKEDILSPEERAYRNNIRF